MMKPFKLVTEDATLINIHRSINMGLGYDDIDLYDVTLAMNGGSSFNQEWNRSSDTSSVHPFMTIPDWTKYELCDVYDDIAQWKQTQKRKPLL